ncbi:hypothetical protein E1264_06505 [Actinomadura sp. KC216]|uniref:hypothetical protein n=1 Tax=Actinomadura sp. KC216 TaxID=2530370 RepID=UPI001042A3DB|nr:hypothetical protein [Actinomadura sp. KC216]TDB89967.1 hypothetical protein E1264_06505 [Actinomadura sp. KC216]
MARDAARAGAVAVPSRRVAVVRRLLVLGGLLIAGWILGCVAQSAHADEVPVPSPDVVAEAPALERAVETATERPPMPDVVQAVVESPPPADAGEAMEPAVELVTPDAAPLQPEVSASVPDAGVVSVPLHRWTPDAVSARSVGTDGGQSVQRTVRHHPAPVPAPERPDDHSVAGGLAMSGVTAGFPSAVAWAPVPARAPSGRLPGAVPPAVRTAADEPSFAPD